MAKIASFGFDQLTKELEAVANNTDNIAEKALDKGADHMNRKLHEALDAQKVTKDREHKTNRLLDYEKKALQDGMYVSDIKKYSSGNTIKAISFSGYADHPTKTYPTGVPTIMLARAITKGTTFRKKNRFFPRTVNKYRQETEEIMANTAENELKKYIK